MAGFRYFFSSTNRTRVLGREAKSTRPFATCIKWMHHASMPRVWVPRNLLYFSSSRFLLFFANFIYPREFSYLFPRFTKYGKSASYFISSTPIILFSMFSTSVLTATLMLLTLMLLLLTMLVSSMLLTIMLLSLMLLTLILLSFVLNKIFRKFRFRDNAFVHETSPPQYLCMNVCMYMYGICTPI